MTDFPDPNYRDPMRANRDPNLPADSQPWSNATWGWIAGIAVVVLVLAVMFSGGDSTRTADQPANPPETRVHGRGRGERARSAGGPGDADL